MILQKLLIYILRSSIYGTLVGLIILLLKSTLLKRLQSKYQFLIWLVMLFKVIFPMGPQSNISILIVQLKLQTITWLQHKHSTVLKHYQIILIFLL